MERYQDKVVLITGAGDVAEAAAKLLPGGAGRSHLRAEGRGVGRGAPYGHKVRRAEV